LRRRLCHHHRLPRRFHELGSPAPPCLSPPQIRVQLLRQRPRHPASSPRPQLRCLLLRQLRHPPRLPPPLPPPLTLKPNCSRRRATLPSQIPPSCTESTTQSAPTSLRKTRLLQSEIENRNRSSSKQTHST